MPGYALKEDYIDLKIFPVLACRPESPPEAGSSANGDSGWPDQDQFQHAPLGVGRSSTLGVGDLKHCAKHRPKRAEVLASWAAMSTASLEESVAAAGLWLLSATEEQWAFLSHVGWPSKPLAEWKDSFAKAVALCQRRGGLQCACGMALPDADNFTKKMGSLLGRSLKDADWDQEQERSLPAYAMRGWPRPDGLRDVGQQWREEMASIQAVARDIVEHLRDSAEPMDKWWGNRAITTPSGSSSLRWLADKARKDPLVSSMDRANKKTVVEYLPSWFLKASLSQKPFTWARLSTKPEHGEKHRALYAQDDVAVQIAGYASAKIEQKWQPKGMCLKQDPHQITEWAVSTFQGTGGIARHSWVSLDYTDFNKEHTKLHLNMLNLALAKRWAAESCAYPDCLDKARAALWTAESHLNAWQRNKDVWSRSWSGLWSGSRDTARDNSALHKAYSLTVQRWCRQEDPNFVEPSIVYISGDDEDSRFSDWCSLVTYAVGHEAMGFHINRAKQLCGSQHHEFLQREARGRGRVTRPLASVLANLATGSWYKADMASPDCYIAAISDNCWEAVRRGLPQDLAKCVAGRLLDRLVRARLQPLEWYEHRNLLDGHVHPLWNHPGGRAVPPVTAAEHVYNPDMQGLATSDRVSQLVAAYSLSDLEASRYARSLVAENHGPLYRKHRAGQERTGAAEALGPRRSHKCHCSLQRDTAGPPTEGTATPRLHSGHEVLRKLAMHRNAARMPGIKETLASMGADMRLVSVLGSLTELLKRAPPHKWSGYSPEAQAAEVEAAEALLLKAARLGLAYEDDAVLSQLKETIKWDMMVLGMSEFSQ